MPQASKTRPLGFQFDFVDHVPLQPVMKKKLPREVMCGLLIRRASRYYAWSPRVLLFFSFAASSCHTAQVVNIMLMLGLISSDGLCYLHGCLPAPVRQVCESDCDAADASPRGKSRQHVAALKVDVSLFWERAEAGFNKTLSHSLHVRSAKRRCSLVSFR